MSSGAGMVIVGAGQAGARAALTLREEGWSGPLTLIGEENATPYERPPLSKAVLTGEAMPDASTICDRTALSERDITFLAGACVAGIDKEARSVALIDGRELRYYRLLLATGARARRVALPGADLEAWRNADRQGAHAARNMLGASAHYRDVPWFWSDQYDLTLQIAGLPSLADHTIARDPVAQMPSERQVHPDPRTLASPTTGLRSLLC